MVNWHCQVCKFGSAKMSATERKTTLTDHPLSLLYKMYFYMSLLSSLLLGEKRTSTSRKTLERTDRVMFGSKFFDNVLWFYVLAFLDS